VTLVILYPFSVRYVCKLDSWAHILWAFGFGLKIGCDNTPTLDFGTILKDRHRLPDQPIAQQGIHTRGYSEAK
jgi:hypothetical protein